jgi:phospholipase C
MKSAKGLLRLLLALGATLAYATGPQGTIQHVIIVIQENRTPTNLFFGYTNSFSGPGLYRDRP